MLSESLRSSMSASSFPESTLPLDSLSLAFWLWPFFISLFSYFLIFFASFRGSSEHSPSINLFFFWSTCGRRFRLTFVITDTLSATITHSFCSAILNKWFSLNKIASSLELNSEKTDHFESCLTTCFYILVNIL